MQVATHKLKSKCICCSLIQSWYIMFSSCLIFVDLTHMLKAVYKDGVHSQKVISLSCKYVKTRGTYENLYQITKMLDWDKLKAFADNRFLLKLWNFYLTW